MCTTLPRHPRDGDGHREGRRGVARPRGPAPAAAPLVDGRADEPVHLALDRRAAGRRSVARSTSCSSTRAHAGARGSRSAATRCAASAARPASTSARCTARRAGTPTTRRTRGRSGRSCSRSSTGERGVVGVAAVRLDALRRLCRRLPGPDRHPAHSSCTSAGRSCEAARPGLGGRRAARCSGALSLERAALRAGAAARPRAPAPARARRLDPRFPPGPLRGWGRSRDLPACRRPDVPRVVGVA